MMAPTHALFGACCYLAVPILPADQVATAALGALIADVDLKHSWMGQTSGPAGWFIRLFAGGHRNLTHEWWVPLAIGALGWFFVSNPFGIAIFIGYVSHLIGDRIPDTGGHLESLIRFSLVVALIGIVIIRTVY
jgi:hypothetical protein